MGGVPLDSHDTISDFLREGDVPQGEAGCMNERTMQALYRDREPCRIIRKPKRKIRDWTPPPP